MLHTRVKAPHIDTVFDHLWNGKEAQIPNLMTKAFRKAKELSSYFRKLSWYFILPNPPAYTCLPKEEPALRMRTGVKVKVILPKRVECVSGRKKNSSAQMSINNGNTSPGKHAPPGPMFEIHPPKSSCD